MIDLLTYPMMWLEMLIKIMLTSISWSVMTKEIQNNASYRKKSLVGYLCII